MSDYHPPLRPTPPRSREGIVSGVATPRTITPLSTPAISSDATRSLQFPLAPATLEQLVHDALTEDHAFNDISTLATVISTRHVRTQLVARTDGVIAGLPLAIETFRQLDPAITIRVEVEDGMVVKKGGIVLHLTGHARGMLSAERTALNYLQHLSGIATLTAAFVAAVEGTGAHILDTRKTTPGWRLLQKYAVRCGGGRNHRMDLQSGVLIKDNHLAAVNGDIAAAVSRARALAAKGTPIQVECDHIAQVKDAVNAGADCVLLDNMSLDMLRDAVAICGDRVTTEASGGVTLATVRGIAETGVARISVGALTHSAPALDLGLDSDAR